MEKTTEILIGELQQLGPDELTGYFKKYADQVRNDEKQFSAYMKKMFRLKGLKQQEVFLAADISEGYGYKLLSEEKRTRQRDLVLKLCIAGHFNLEEVQRALKLYGFSPLYPRVRRDSVLIVAINREIYEFSQINELLNDYALPALYECRDPE